MEKLPYELMPGEVGTVRESIFLERAIVGERIRLAMGLPLRAMRPSTRCCLTAWRRAPLLRSITIPH